MAKRELAYRPTCYRPMSSGHGRGISKFDAEMIRQAEQMQKEAGKALRRLKLK